MQEPNISTRVPHPDDLIAEISCESTKEPNNVPMSICFLVREQAKSLVAIQDLQKRLNHVENVQVDVVDTLMQFRNILCESTNSDNSSSSYLTDSKNSATATPKFNVTTYHSTIEPPRSILKTNSYPIKVTENICNDYQQSSSLVAIQDQPHKHFDSTKSKDSALESDKQDSGLDSDCRDHNEGHLSVKFAPNLVNHETNDQLLQLLDEISCRSEYLQKQLAIVEESAILSDVKEGMISASGCSKPQSEVCSFSERNVLETTLEALETSNSSDKSKDFKSSSADISQEVGVQVAFPSTYKPNNSGFIGFLEGKSFCDREPNSKKRIGKSIDSALVSSILKETNVVDLQRQALIYLVDNAVLNTKLRELEKVISSKNVESDKVENSLKEEARLLMMENRELRICLDEQKLETNVLRSRVAMLERVLQSMNVENQELNWQLGESLNLQQLSQKGFSNLSSSFSPGGLANISRPSRKTSSLPSQGCRNSSISCTKSKLLSNANSFLETTIEESDSSNNQMSRTKCRNGPIQSSTPFQRLKGSVTDSPNAGSPVSFYSVKKCLKSGHIFDSDGASFRSAKSERHSGDCDIPEACVKNHVFSRNTSNDTLTLPMGNVSKFPFNTILEKLKANSECRLSRSASYKDSEVSASASDLEIAQALKASATQDQIKNHIIDSKSPQANDKSSVQTRKNRNIHQRIQNILDRIVAESEEAS